MKSRREAVRIRLQTIQATGRVGGVLRPKRIEIRAERDVTARADANGCRQVMRSPRERIAGATARLCRRGRGKRSGATAVPRSMSVCSLAADEHLAAAVSRPACPIGNDNLLLSLDWNRGLTEHLLRCGLLVGNSRRKWQ